MNLTAAYQFLVVKHARRSVSWCDKMAKTILDIERVFNDGRTFVMWEMSGRSNIKVHRLNRAWISAHN